MNLLLQSLIFIADVSNILDLRVNRYERSRLASDGTDYTPLRMNWWRIIIRGTGAVPASAHRPTARESLWRDRHGGITSPAFQACGPITPFRTRFCHSSQKQSSFSTPDKYKSSFSSLATHVPMKLCHRLPVAVSRARVLTQESLCLSLQVLL
jgi:hypothetical protein